MAYTYDLTTDIGKVRRDIGDTVEADAHFTDAELQSFLDEGGSVKSGSGLALLSWSAALAREDESVKAGSWSGDRGDVSAKMAALADKYLKLGGYTPTAAVPTFRQAAVDWTPEVQAERIYWEQV